MSSYLEYYDFSSSLEKELIQNPKVICDKINNPDSNERYETFLKYSLAASKLNDEAIEKYFNKFEKLYAYFEKKLIFQAMKKK